MKSILFLCILFLTTLLYSQSKTSDQLVADFLGSEQYAENLENNPGLIKFLKVKATQGYSIESVPKLKYNHFKQLSSVFYIDKEIPINQFVKDIQSPDFNFLKYSFPNNEKGVFQLRSKNSTVIYIYSNAYINQKVRNL